MEQWEIKLIHFYCLLETWKAAGCYQNTGRALADILRGVNGKRTVSKKLNVCRKTADAKGITVFGLDDKQCWTGQNAADTFNKYGNSGQCYTNKGGKSMGYFASESMSVYKKNDKGKFKSSIKSNYVCSLQNTML